MGSFRAEFDGLKLQFDRLADFRSSHGTSSLPSALPHVCTNDLDVTVLHSSHDFASASEQHVVLAQGSCFTDPQIQIH